MIEMLMVLAIFTILTSIVMYNYSEFNSKTIMSNMAYEIALSVRQAQVYSLGVRGQAGNEEFDNRYGVYFNNEYNGGKNFIFFFDKKPVEAGGEPNGWCDGDANEPNCMACVSGGECLEKVTLTRDIFVGQICISDSIDPVSENGICNGTNSSKDDASITFDRPNPDAKVSTSDTRPYNVPKNVGIVVKNKFGNQRAVIIRSTGQISVIMLKDAI